MLKAEKANALLNFLLKDLSTGKQTDVINEIFYDKCDSIDKILFSNKGYKDYIERLKELYDLLEKSKANKEILKLVDDYIDLSSENMGYSNQLFYRIGFKDGLSLLLATMNGDDINAVYNKPR